MIKGTTSSGFAYQITEERLNNYELVEAIGELEENPLVIPKTMNLLLGKEQTKKLKELVRTEDGMVPVDKISEVITEIFKDQGHVKNS